MDFATHEVVEQYVYDPAGNILRKTVNGRTTVYTYDKANQLVSSECNGKITKYEYDAVGRLVKEGKRSYSYSWLDKVSRVKENGVEVASFTYHMDGQIATAKANGRQENFLWDNLALISRNETEYVNEPYVTGGNPILADGDVLFNDLLGSTIGIRSGKEYRETGMTAFGETDEKSAMFTGKPYIGELGYAFLFRNYRPGLGKWQTSDPLGYPDGWNNLAYVNNGVIEYIDQEGAWALEVLGNMHGTGKLTFGNRVYDINKKTYLQPYAVFTYDIAGSGTSYLSFNVSITLAIAKTNVSGTQNNGDLLSTTATIIYRVSVNSVGEVSRVLNTSPNIPKGDDNNKIKSISSSLLENSSIYTLTSFASIYQKYGDAKNQQVNDFSIYSRVGQFKVVE